MEVFSSLRGRYEQRVQNSFGAWCDISTFVHVQVLKMLSLSLSRHITTCSDALTCGVLRCCHLFLHPSSSALLEASSLFHSPSYHQRHQISVCLFWPALK